MSQKTVELTKNYLKRIQARGHENCYHCKVQFMIGDMAHAILRKNGRGQSKYYHESCFEEIQL